MSLFGMHLSKSRLVGVIGLIFFLHIHLLLGESHLNYIFLGLGAGWLLVFSWLTTKDSLQVPDSNITNLAWWLWIVFLGVVVISAMASSSLPLSLLFIARWFFLWLVFWFVIASKDWFISTLWLKILLLLGFVLALLSLFFLVSPEAANQLPGMNLLYAKYGHNHLAAVLLPIIPLSWWWVANRYVEQKGRHSLAILLPIFFSSMLLISYGRVAVLLGGVQLLGIYFYFKKLASTQPQLTKLNKTMPIVIFCFGLVFVAKVALSVAPTYFPQLPCLVPAFKQQLCKSITHEPRPLYWQRAWLVLQEHPLLGSGPGTFSLSAKKYQQSPHTSSSYAHNIYLQMFSELGVMGGFAFIGLMGGLLLLSTVGLKMSQGLSWRFLTVISIGTMYLNIAFDFDWDFIGVAILTTILLAICVGAAADLHTRMLPAVKIQQVIHFVLFQVLGVGLIGLACLYLATDALLLSGKTTQAFTLFPYFHWHRKLFEVDASLSPQDRKKFFAIYAYHPDMYASQIISSDTEHEKQLLKEKVVELDPWQMMSYDLSDYYVARGEYGTATEKVLQHKQFLEKAEAQKWYVSDYQTKHDVAFALVKLANEWYLQGNVERAAELYQQARWGDPWILDKQEPAFITTNLPLEKQLLFFRQVWSIPLEFFGRYRQSYMQRYYLAVVGAYERDDRFFMLDVERIAGMSSELQRGIWQQIGMKELAKSQKFLENEQWFEAQQYADASYDIWSSALRSTNQIDYANQQELADVFVSLGNAHLMENPSLLASNYKKAQQLNPWILLGGAPWVSAKPQMVNSLSTADLVEYVDILSEEKELQLYWEHSDHAVIFDALIRRLIAEENYEQVLPLTKKAANWTLFDFSQRKELGRVLQQQADALIKKGEYLAALDLISALATVLPDDYWSLAQPAHLALLMSEDDKAKELFVECTERYEATTSRQHEDCARSADAQTGDLNDDLYWETSKVIIELTQ